MDIEAEGSLASVAMDHQHIQGEISAAQKLLEKNNVSVSSLNEVIDFVRRWRRAEATINLAQKAVGYLNMWDALEKLGACYVVGSEMCWLKGKEMQLAWVKWETWMGVGPQSEEVRIIKDSNWRGALTNAIRAMGLPWDAKWRRDLPCPRLGFWKNIHFETRKEVMWIDRGFIPDDVGPLTQDPNVIDPFCTAKSDDLVRANVYLGILLKRLWALPMSTAREGENPSQIWGRMVGLFAQALNALQGENL